MTWPVDRTRLRSDWADGSSNPGRREALNCHESKKPQAFPRCGYRASIWFGYEIPAPVLAKMTPIFDVVKSAIAASRQDCCGCCDPATHKRSARGAQDFNHWAFRSGPPTGIRAIGRRPVSRNRGPRTSGTEAERLQDATRVSGATDADNLKRVLT